MVVAIGQHFWEAFDHLLTVNRLTQDVTVNKALILDTARQSIVLASTWKLVNLAVLLHRSGQLC